MNRLYGIVFKDGGQSYFYKSFDEYNINDYVLVDSERGKLLGKIVSICESSDIVEKGSILKKASDEEYNEHLVNLKDADKAYHKCSELVKELELNMHVINAQFNFDRSQLLFNFTAEERVDFRELARRLAAIYHTRIELHQIGARDKAKDVGGIGICGKKLCCSSFLKQIETVTMNMAKNQNLALNPSKINGCCGRLLCCLAYEDNEYLECSKGMPSVGDEIKCPSGRGIVQSVDILNRKCTVLVDGEKEDVYYDS